MSNNGGYGALASSQSGNGGRGGDEAQPLLGGKPPSNSIVTKFRRSMTVNVKRDRGDVILILCYLITGLLDSASISIWGSFVSMQTGK